MAFHVTITQTNDRHYLVKHKTETGIQSEQSYLAETPLRVIEILIALLKQQ